MPIDQSEQKQKSFILVRNCHIVPWHIFKLGSMEDSQIHIKKYFFKSQQRIKMPARNMIYATKLFSYRKLSPPFCKRDYALPWLENIIKQNYWS